MYPNGRIFIQGQRNCQPSPIDTWFYSVALRYVLEAKVSSLPPFIGMMKELRERDRDQRYPLFGILQLNSFFSPSLF